MKQLLFAAALMLAATCWLDRAFDSFRRQSVAFALEATFTIASVGTVGALSRLLDPVAVTWVFGAMGSWNDIGVEDALKARYDATSEVLFQALSRAVCVAANSTYRA